MDDERDAAERRFHHREAAELFNHVWSLIEKPDRTPEETDEMIHAAHASRHHWSRVGTAANLAIGEWQISRVYAVVERPEPALYHGARCLKLAQSHGLDAFNTAYAHEALARAYALATDGARAKLHRSRAAEIADGISDTEDRQALLDDLASIRIP